MQRTRTRRLARTAAVGAASAMAAVAIAACGATTQHGNVAGGNTGSARSGPLYSYYRSMMGRYGGGMMGGGPGGWMMGAGGFRWMTGLNGVPGWMRGGRLPRYMMGTRTDPGKIMGRFWANAPGPRVSRAQATALAGQVPNGSKVSRGTRTITFTSMNVSLAVVASPPGGPDETFRIAGLVNPKLIIPARARVTFEVVNADPDTAHGLVVTRGRAASTWMPMMYARPAFAGSALWFLGDPTAAGLHVGMLRFTAATTGTYHYYCPVPGHAQKGMIGTLIIRSAG